jgi:HAD superfamily hydrolase (TIGR01509 family)
VNRQLKAIIFDFNGVIVDDEPLHLELIQRVLREEGNELADAHCRAISLGVPDHTCFPALLQAGGCAQRANDSNYVNALITRKASYYAQAIAERDLLFPGVAQLIETWAARVPLAIVSGALRQEIEFVLGRSGLRQYFQTIIAAEDVRAGKPDPEGFLKALTVLNEQARIAPAECLVIEDSLAGIAAAKRAGMFCVAVTNSYTAEELQAADVIVPSLIDCNLADLFVSQMPATIP